MFFRRQRASANDGLPWPRSSEWRRTLAATVRTSVQGKEPQPTVACSVRRRGSTWRFLPAARGQEHASSRTSLSRIFRRDARCHRLGWTRAPGDRAARTPHVGERVSQAGSASMFVRPCTRGALHSCGAAELQALAESQRWMQCAACIVMAVLLSQERVAWVVGQSNAMGWWCTGFCERAQPIRGRDALRPAQKPPKPTHAATGPMAPWLYHDGNLSQALNWHQPSKHHGPSALLST
jgi:hypothetical protein